MSQQSKKKKNDIRDGRQRKEPLRQRQKGLEYFRNQGGGENRIAANFFPPISRTERNKMASNKRPIGLGGPSVKKPPGFWEKKLTHIEWNLNPPRANQKKMHEQKKLRKKRTTKRGKKRVHWGFPQVRGLQTKDAQCPGGGLKKKKVNDERRTGRKSKPITLTITGPVPGKAFSVVL